MAIIIKKKKALSNKPETPPKIEINDGENANSGTHTVDEKPKVFIDKISIVVNVPDELGHAGFDALKVQTADTSLFKAVKAGKGFNRAWQIAIDCTPSSTKWPLFMASWDKTTNKALKWRLEFSPIDLGKIGIEELHAALMMVVDKGWKTFIEHGRVTMLEVTTDLEGVNVDQFDPIPKQAVYRQVWGKDGDLPPGSSLNLM